MADPIDLHRKRSPRAADTAGGVTPNGRNPMDAAPTLHEARRLGDPFDDASRELEETRLAAGRTVADLIGTDVQIAREALLRAMQTADRHGATEENRQVGVRLLALDDLMTFLSDRSGM